MVITYDTSYIQEKIILLNSFSIIVISFLLLQFRMLLKIKLNFLIRYCYIFNRAKVLLNEFKTI